MSPAERDPCRYALHRLAILLRAAVVKPMKCHNYTQINYFLKALRY